MTKAQKKLKKYYGTPEEFGQTLIQALGEISVFEAQQALRRYEKKWKKAGK